MRKVSPKKHHPVAPFLHYTGITIAVFLAIGITYYLGKGTSTIPCANTLSCSESLQLKVENNTVGVFNNHPIVAPPITLSQSDTQLNVLGESSGPGEKHIYVDLSKQKVYAYEGDTLYMEATISSGKWNRTPTGDFTVWTKLRSTRMSGGTGADYYNLPNVPYVMFFSNNEVSAAAGYSFHGAYWHNNFGHPMSHGCINMKSTDAEKLYNWADNKIKVSIYGEAPL